MEHKKTGRKVAGQEAMFDVVIERKERPETLYFPLCGDDKCLWLGPDFKISAKHLGLVKNWPNLSGFS
jgi:hypothetical protein